MSESESKPRTNTSNRQLSGMQILFASILAIGLLLTINFRERIIAGQRIQQNLQALEIEVAALETEQAELQQELNYVSGDDYVQSWARADGKLLKEGEVLVVPVPANVPQPTVTPTNNTPPILMEVEPATPANWRLWWALFFDAPPPVR